MSDNDKEFKTHIREPRWQQVASVIIVLGVVSVWTWVVLHRHQLLSPTNPVGQTQN